MDKLEEIKNKISEFQAKSAAKEEIKAFITLVLQVLKNSKDSFDKLSDENLQTIKESIAFIEQNYTKWDKTLDSKINTATGEFERNITLLKALIAKVKTIKPVDGIDGHNPDPSEVVPLVIAKLPKVEPFILKRDEVVKEINLGKKDDLKIELKQIESLDKIHTKLTDSIINRAIGIVDQRTSFLIHKVSNIQSQIDSGTIGGASTLAQVSTGSTTTANSLYTMTSGVPVNFQRSGGSSLLYLDETNGRIGVGTTTPTSLLSVGSTSQFQVTSSGLVGLPDGTNTAAGMSLYWLGDTDTGLYRPGANEISFVVQQSEKLNVVPQGLKLNGAGSATTPNIFWNGDTNTGLYSPSADALGLTTGGTARVYIDSTGNVGIGTTGPGQALHVYKASGNSYVEVDGTAANNIGYRIHQDGTTKWIMYAPGSTSDLRFNDGSDRITFQSGGNVGIGTTGPNTALTIEASTNQLNLRKIGSTWGLLAGAGDNYGPVANSAFLINVNATPLVLGTNNTVNVTIQNGGNVGIGTTGPTAYLQIKAGTATANTAPLKFTSGTLNTTAEAGAVEFLTDAFYGTITTGAARKTFAFLESPSLVTPTANYFLRSVGNALTATGTTRTDALQLAKEINNITTAAAGTGVILPVGVVGMRITIFNAGANLIQVYASASETIDTVAGSTGVPLTNTKRCEYFFTTTNTWISAQLGVISA